MAWKLGPIYRNSADPLEEQRWGNVKEGLEFGPWVEPTFPNANVIQRLADPLKMRLEFGGRIVRFSGQVETTGEGAGGKGLKTGETVFTIAPQFARLTENAIWISVTAFTNATNEYVPIMVKKVSGTSKEFLVKVGKQTAEEKLAPNTDIPFHWVSYAIDDV